MLTALANLDALFGVQRIFGMWRIRRIPPVSDPDLPAGRPGRHLLDAYTGHADVAAAGGAPAAAGARMPLGGCANDTACMPRAKSTSALGGPQRWEPSDGRLLVVCGGSARDRRALARLAIAAEVAFELGPPVRLLRRRPRTRRVRPWSSVPFPAVLSLAPVPKLREPVHGSAQPSRVEHEAQHRGQDEHRHYLPGEPGRRARYQHGLVVTCVHQRPWSRRPGRSHGSRSSSGFTRRRGRSVKPSAV